METTIEEVVAPVLHRYDVAPVAVSVTFPPAQKVVGPLGVTTTVGAGSTFTTTGVEVPVHPSASVAITV